MTDLNAVHEATEVLQSHELPQEVSMSVVSLSTDFVPTPAMIRFRDALVITPTTRHSIQRVCRQAGLHEKTYFKWVERWGNSFKKWVWNEIEGMRFEARIRLEVIGMDRAGSDYRYWSKMMDILSREDTVPTPATGNLETIQRITAQYTLEEKKEDRL